jgi:methyl-accepting chemotaxis protein
MLAHGEALAAGSAEVLGELQYQDVVRQCVERLRAAVDRRNDVLGDAFAPCPAPPSPAQVAALIDSVVDDYLAAEALHGGKSEDGATPAIELF